MGAVREVGEDGKGYDEDQVRMTRVRMKIR